MRIPNIVKESVKSVRPDIYRFSGMGKDDRHTLEKLIK